MKKLKKDKGIFNTTFNCANNCRIVNTKNEDITEWGLNKIIYLKSSHMIIAAVDIMGRLHLYPTWKSSRANLIRICKFTGISTKDIKHYIAIGHSDIILEKKIKFLNL